MLKSRVVVSGDYMGALCYIAAMGILNEKNLVLGLSGGIACYKAAELCRALVKAGASVQVVMTEAATAFITPVTLQALSGQAVYLSQWDARQDNNMAHINLTRSADAILVAPASADFMAKLLHGRADDLLSLACLARPIERVPLLLAPAMNREMWAHPATQRNVAQLRADGCTVLGVGQGDQACGEVGDGRMLEADELLHTLEAFFAPKVLQGRRVLVNAGPTYEAIDPVRGITNRSSGKMGFAIARAAADAGAHVTLVAGPVALPTPHGVQRIDVVSAQDMHAAVLAQAAHADVFVAAAAVADWRVDLAASQKIKKEAGVAPRLCAFWKTQTSWPRWQPPRERSAGHCSAWALRLKAKTCWPMLRPSGCAKTCLCWWATSGRPHLAKTTTPCCWWTSTDTANSHVPVRPIWRAN
jgi:phosphopantothenoylcysteine decarboxylase/phosphopantothenate--cysteine ligase